MYTMHRIVPALLCLAWTGHSRRVQSQNAFNPSSPRLGNPHEKLKPFVSIRTPSQGPSMQALQKEVEAEEQTDVDKDKARKKLVKIFRFKYFKSEADVERVIEEVQPQSAREYADAIDAFCRSGFWERGLAHFDELRERGIPLNENIFKSALIACEKGKQWERSLSLLDEMCEKEMEPQAVYFQYVISACYKSGQLEQVLSLFDEMREAGLLPTEKTYNTIINACKQEALWEQALFLLEESKKRGLRKDMVDFARRKDSIIKLRSATRNLQPSED
mmetsp:Transcript_133388/g.249411  ORF Transcript_133388/g.249411 Transcript_133388/m.249411 type:complete len:275 (+) Transcript_133388:43-867(+)